MSSYMEPWTASCTGCPGDLPSPTADSRVGCLHSRPCPSGQCSTEVDLPPLSLQVHWCGVHSICDGDFRGGWQKTLFPSFTLGKAISQRVGYQDFTADTSVCTKQLFHRTAIALWRGNATLWLHCQPTLPPSIDGCVNSILFVFWFFVLFLFFHVFCFSCLFSVFNYVCIFVYCLFCIPHLVLSCSLFVYVVSLH